MLDESLLETKTKGMSPRQQFKAHLLIICIKYVTPHHHMHRFTIDIETIINQQKKLDFKQQTLAEDDHTTRMCTFAAAQIFW